MNCDDISLMKTEHNHSYCLLKLTKYPYVTENVVSDDYGYAVPPSYRVVKGHYLEIQTNNSDEDIL